MNRKLRPAALLALLAAASASQAVTLTDTFIVDQAGLTLTSPGTSTTPPVSLGNGVERSLILTQNENPDPGLGESSVRVSGGAFAFDNFPLVASNYSIDYTYSAPADFSGLTGFEIDFRNNDLPYELFVEVTDASGLVSTFTGNVQAGSAFTVFAGGATGSADLARVARISFQSETTTPAVDSSITRVQSVQPVPEPATMAALGLGAAALLRRRKRANKS